MSSQNTGDVRQRRNLGQSSHEDTRDGATTTSSVATSPSIPNRPQPPPLQTINVPTTNQFINSQARGHHLQAQLPGNFVIDRDGASSPHRDTASSVPQYHPSQHGAHGGKQSAEPVATLRAKLYKYADFCVGLLFLIAAAALFVYTAKEALVLTGFTKLIHSERARNEYKGYRIPAGEDYQCERIRLESISSAKEFLDKYISRRMPVIVETDAGSKSLGWNTHLWTSEYLKNIAGDVTVPVSSINRSNETDELEFLATTRSLRDLLEEVNNHQKAGTSHQVIIARRAGGDVRVLQEPLNLLSKDFSIPHFLMSFPIVSMEYLFGTSGSHLEQADKKTFSTSGGPIRSFLYNEDWDFTYMQLKGDRQVRFYSPADVWNLYPWTNPDRVEVDGSIAYGVSRLVGGRAVHFSRIDPPALSALGVDYIRQNFPRFLKTRPAVCTLREGELLFLPAGWYRQWTDYGKDHSTLSFVSSFQRDYFTPVEKIDDTS